MRMRPAGVAAAAPTKRPERVLAAGHSLLA
jgi:hypothetical protein